MQSNASRSTVGTGAGLQVGINHLMVVILKIKFGMCELWAILYSLPPVGYKSIIAAVALFDELKSRHELSAFSIL
jgi:hypothetical protein